MSTIPSITVEELHSLLQNQTNVRLIDVREQDEHAQAAIADSILVPLATVPEHMDEWPKDGEMFVHCKAGGRSARAVQFLQSQGFTKATNITGGMDAWIQAGYPVIS
jgi:rhodanese-related sulfurtransferase